MDLFTHAQTESPTGQPLAERLRPRRIEDMLGQTQILGSSAPWRRLLDSGRVPSLILWGPPGSGKTTFALLLAQKVDAEFITVNAVETGAKALRELGDQGRARRLERQRKTLLFIDEIHRLNKGQQDILLPFIEKGDLVLVGATTENPSYEINSALLSRCRILTFQRLGDTELSELANRAASEKSLTLESLLDSEALTRLLQLADGDGRRLLNLMELILNLRATPDHESEWPLKPEALAHVLDAPSLRYDKSADEHYDTISAFIKSVRGSNPDASSSRAAL